MNKLQRTRLKLGCIAFVLVLGTAWAKNWFPNISIEIVGLAVINILGYIFADTIRPSKK